MRLNELFHDLNFGWVSGAHHDDRDIARDAMTPERALAASVLEQHASGSTPGGISVDQSPGQLCIGLDLGFGNAEFAQGQVGPSEIKTPVDHVGVVKFLGQRHCGFPGFRHTEYKVDANRSIWSQSE